ncbi:ferritin-like domain-containing protein [Pseudarthrobacter sp. NS4]|uniref:ferritin-like domain-containing protein n=1 Tax=Pseudarthrobacter sp. NS4 TaxID=2973976 RepID=UPI002161D5E5|nr:ferritin-like domain-containing protein [Pseudarthrobacter sp. NS4]
MNDDNQENRPRMRYFRYAVLSLAALLVLSLGFALIPAEPPAPQAPPFSEQARTAAFEDALKLRTAGRQLAAGTTDGGAAASAHRVVTLLTIQARALLLPEDAAPASASATSTAPPASAAPEMTMAGLATALAASGSQRLKDAETADGGMARLLAGAGTAQLLAARDLAAAAGAPEAVAGYGRAAANAPEPGTPPTPCPSVPPAATGPGTALAAAAVAEQEAVYGYQAALTRLPPAEAGPASEFLDRHQVLAVDAEALSRLYCGTPPPQQPGYVLDAGFLAAPAAGLARLEAATLPAYGDVVALTHGPARAWALSAMQSAADRALHWGGDPGPVPGLALDEAQLPPLPG